MKFESRATVGLREPESRPRIPGPVESLTVHYNGPTVGITAAFPHSACRAFWRGVQKFHMDTREWVDVAYSIAACQHGILMAGRGAGVRTAANGTNRGNSISYAIFCMIGGKEKPTAQMLNAVAEARIGFGNLRLRYHSYWKATSCAGPHLNLWANTNPFAKPKEINETKDDDMTPEQDSRLRRLEDAVNKLVTELESDKSDTKRIRRTVRSIAAKLGIDTGNYEPPNSVDA